jgi:hypothetical protein
LLSRARALAKMTGDLGMRSEHHTKARSAMHFLESAMNSLQPSSGLSLDEGRSGSTHAMVLQVANQLIDGLAGPGPSQSDVYKSGNKAAFQGQAPAIAISELLGFLSSHQKTGVLEVTALSETVVIGLRNGAVIHASSDNTPAGLRLGEILVAKRAIDERTLFAVLGKATQSRQTKLGELLEREGRIPREVVRSALEFQIQQLFHRLFAMREACYAFYERDASNVDAMMSMNITHLLLESATNADGRPAKAEQVSGN